MYDYKSYLCIREMIKWIQEIVVMECNIIQPNPIFPNLLSSNLSVRLSTWRLDDAIHAIKQMCCLDPTSAALDDVPNCTATMINTALIPLLPRYTSSSFLLSESINACDLCVCVCVCMSDKAPANKVYHRAPLA